MALLGRPWVDAPTAAPPPSGGQRLRVCSYNVLAQCYTRSALFPWCPAAALKWKNRSAALLRDIDALAPDVLLLQELDEFAAFWEAELKDRGYGAVYKQRTGVKKDGCAIVWRTARLTLEASEAVDHNDLAAGLPPRPAGAPERADGEGGAAALDERTKLERDCVGVIARLALRDSGARLVVATTHLYWDPALAAVKLAQAAHMLRRCAAFRSDEELPLVFGGDFNSMPDSDVYALLTSPRGAEGCPPLRSAHALASGGAEPPFTNLTPKFKGCLDYLLLSDDVALQRVLALPQPGLGEGLPDAQHPSDHLPLVMDCCI